MKKVLLLVFLCLIFLPGCNHAAKDWTGFYYPDGRPENGKVQCQIQAGFATKSECEAWAELKTANSNKTYTYCGNQCNYSDDCQYICGND